MKKTSIRITTIALTLILLLHATCAYAMRAPLHPGDINRDINERNAICLNDVVLLQRYIASLEELTKTQLYCADVTADGNADMLDVVDIQKYIAGLIKNFKQEEHYDYYTEIKTVYADYSSGKAMAGVPVTFTAIPYQGQEPFRYSYSINGNTVAEYTTDNTLVYTFPHAGEYEVTVYVFNGFDDMASTTFKYKVVHPYTSDKPMVKTFYMDRLSVCEYDTNYTFTAEAFMGEGPYLYRFLLDGLPATEEFSEKNTFTVEEELSQMTHTVTVQIKDKNSGDSFVSENFNFYVDIAKY